MNEIRADEPETINPREGQLRPPHRSSHWPFLVLLAIVAFAVAAIFGNLPILLFMTAGLLIVLRFAYRTFLRPYIRMQRIRRARDARAFREVSKN